MCKVLVVDKLISRDFVDSSQKKSFVLNFLLFSSLDGPLFIGSLHLDLMLQAVAVRKRTYSSPGTRKTLFQVKIRTSM